MAHAFQDPLNDAVAARAALPKLCLDWPGELANWLGHQVQEAYPELRAWPVSLAAEAQLLFELYHPPVRCGREVVRHEAFLPFLRSQLEAVRQTSSRVASPRDHRAAAAEHGSMA